MIRNGHAGFGRGVSEKDRKAPRRGPTSADPTGEKARAVKRHYQGTCRGCGAPTSARNGKGDAYSHCRRCRPRAAAPRRSRGWVREAMPEWQRRHGRPPSSTDWSRTHARRRGGEALARLADRDWPSPSTVIDLYGSWAAARTDALNASTSGAPGPAATQGAAHADTARTGARIGAATDSSTRRTAADDRTALRTCP